MLMNPHAVWVCIIFAGGFGVKYFSLYLSVTGGGREEKRKEDEEVEFKGKRQRFDVRAAEITLSLIRAHLETCRIITHGFTV